MMILYIKCLCKSREKILAKRYSTLGYEVRNVGKNQAWKVEARKYGLPLPFTVEGDIVKQLND